MYLSPASYPSLCHILIEEINKTENDRRQKDRGPLKMDKEKEGLNSTEDQKNVDASVSWLQMTQSWKIE